MISLCGVPVPLDLLLLTSLGSVLSKPFFFYKQKLEKHAIIWNQSMDENSMTNFLKEAAFTINISIMPFVNRYFHKRTGS